MSANSDDELLYLLRAIRAGRVRVETRGSYEIKPTHRGPNERVHYDKRTYHIVIEPTAYEKEQQLKAEQHALERDPAYIKSVLNLAEMSDEEYREFYQQPKHAHPAYDPKLHADYYRTRGQMKINVQVDDNGDIKYND